jgi:hypothetical protein
VTDDLIPSPGPVPDQPAIEVPAFTREILDKVIPPEGGFFAHAGSHDKSRVGAFYDPKQGVLIITCGHFQCRHHIITIKVAES